MLESQIIDLTNFIFLSYFYFIFLLFSILELKVKVSMTSYITITNCHISVIIIQSCIIIKIGSERNNVITTCLTYVDPNDNTWPLE